MPAATPSTGLTVIARALQTRLHHGPVIVTTTADVGRALSDWIDERVGDLPADDPRIPGYLDLAARLTPGA